ncbi:hypothetical protein CHL67_03985 [Prosthecochloris sp. GSB1]|uniref:phosphate-starvation-inducible PsiE family protein n=1 Tax=Prosthecochloris sp. GSB1 TaxID=281093 RepID=UPI000B8C7AC8|nr:phosphate-starvation-inducible PsiE family protein [Prosthecochloris sp. GSB1]ASQ90199.1 hypothetical protein CHL67_03985 [Prosthecochloris sp. GSB1]
MNKGAESETIKYHEELPSVHEDRLVGFLHRIIRAAVRVLSVLMVLVIIWGIGDVIHVLYTRLSEPPFLLLNINDLLQTFGAFLAVLIAIEIFINIRLYLGTNIVPVKLVVATALMAISRKVIILDFDKISADYLYGIAAVVLGLGISYWLVTKEAL